MSDREDRIGAIVGGVILIALGIVFLFRDQLHVDWGIVWPFFLIVPGAFLVTRALLARDHRNRTGGFIGGGILLFLGLVFLAQNYLSIDWSTIWPFFLIIPGLGLIFGVLRGRGRPDPVPPVPMTPMPPAPGGWQMDAGVPPPPPAAPPPAAPLPVVPDAPAPAPAAPVVVPPPAPQVPPAGPDASGTPGAPTA